MWRVIFTLLLLCLSPVFANAAFNSFNAASTALVQPDVTCNFATGVSTGLNANSPCIASPTTCNGSTNNTASFNTFAAWAITWQASNPGLLVGLDMTGLNCTLDQSNGAITFNGIKRFLVLGAGATLSPPSGGVIYHLAGSSQYQDNAHSARTATVAAGATFVTLNTAGQTSLFTVGKYALMTGYDEQGLGFPSNQFYFDYVLVSAKDGACQGTGTVCFSTTALTNTYLSTWPLYYAGSAGEVDMGGPATLYALKDGWDTEVEWRGITIAQGVGASHADATGRQVLFRNTTFTASGTDSCVFPTVNYSFTMIDSSMPSCVVEMDKLNQSVSYINTNIGGALNIQSSSGANLLTITNSTINILSGSARNNIFTDVTFTTNSNFGPNRGYGRTDEVVCIRCIGSFFDQSGTPGGFLYKFASDNGLNNVSGASITAGVITIPNSYLTTGSNVRDVAWAVPGTNIFWSNENAGGHPKSMAWQVTGVTQDGTNTYVATTLTGQTGFSGLIPTAGATKLYIKAHPAPRFTCTSCTGSDLMASMSLATARAPIWSYQQFTYTGSIGATAQSQFPLWGNPTQFDYNVTVAYSGGGGVLYVPGTYWTVVLSNNTEANYASPTWGVNAKSVGNRRITRAGGVTCPSGTCTGDSGLAFPDPTLSLFGGISTSGPQYSADVSGSCPGAGCPSVIVTMTADQNVVNP